MVDPDNNTESAAPLSESDDTKTRKTVRLKSSAPVGLNLTPMPAPTPTPQPKAPLSDPLSGRDTDTGNLEVMEDTQTRRTVKLRPISTQAPGALPGIPPVRPAAPAGDGANTQTRKTIVLKPTAVAPAVKLDAPTGSAPESDDTKTRKTVRLRPSAVMPPPIAGSPAAPDAEAEAEAGTDLDSSDTIKIARPPRPGSMIPPKPVMLPGQALTPGSSQAPTHSLPVAKPLPPQTPLPKPGEGLPGSNAVPRVPSVPSVPSVPPAPAAAPRPAAPEEDLLLKPKGSSNEEDPTVLKGPETDAVTGSATASTPTIDGTSPLAEMEPFSAPKSGGSRLFLGFAVICLILVGATLTLTLTQYLNIYRQQNIALPLLSQQK